MRTPIGRIGRFTLFLAAAIIIVIVTGLIVPGRTGTIIEVVGWVALAVCIYFEVGGLRTTPIGNYEGNDRRPY